ncbi:L-aspartate oxidase [Anaerobacillus arseniciselenatis]|uniref:L-aspartate oxidase n=1 Tax=Anaerobacillus arseniciselenatis TaxID=85682 RepID=A0A1S2LID5_9BACI|nr:L-aspartate oxidase [Anaerobacillus arseniciselenatis]OIJ11853.1 L-aspartate oxidase [Anaerobacillus arseniciselenatis]
MNVKKTEVVIIGSGLAGLMTADYLCDQKNVMLITKSELNNSNSMLAQGGIAAAVTKEDHWQEHFEDTIVAGGFHNRKEMTELLVKQGSSLINRLIEIGVAFDKDKNNELSLGMEGAHTKRRILHAGGDATGKVIVEALMSRVIPKIDVCEREMAFDLQVEDGVCQGVFTKDIKGTISYVEADHVIIATGGVGQLYSATSNCREATGDGIAMAYRAGAEIADMEFIQFHPTLLMNGNSSCGLISEAVRGEGAKLVNEEGCFLMKGKHPMEDLAPRDIVAREIFNSKLKQEKIFLNIENVNNFKQRFPSIYQMCEKNPEILKSELLPVEPGAHFIMGGIKVDREGQSSIENLYAVGECAYTGVHGANRLASNSLLEGVVFSERLSKTVLQKKKRTKKKRLTPSIVLKNTSSKNLPTVEQVQEVMDKFAGIIRNKKGLQQAICWFRQYNDLLNDKNHAYLSIQEKVISNMLVVGLLITQASLLRDESRGGHYRSDFSAKNDQRWSGYRSVFVNGELIRERFVENEALKQDSLSELKKEHSC